MNKNKIRFYLSLMLLFTSCVSTSNLANVPVKTVITASNYEFLETRTVSGVNLTLSEIFIQEKQQWGKDISIANVVEQSKTTSVFFIFQTTEKFYIYDVIRNKPLK